MLGHSPPVSPLVTLAATLYAPLSALLHGYRNTKVRRELCQMLGLSSPRGEDEVTPLPSCRMFRSLSMLQVGPAAAGEAGPQTQLHARPRAEAGAWPHQWAPVIREVLILRSWGSSSICHSAESSFCL